MEEKQIRLGDRKPLGVEVFEILRERIISGEVDLGEWLRQEDIARQLGVSQTPVREALDRLVAAGLAERVPYRGVRVVTLSEEEVADIYAARLLLETAVARGAAHHLSGRHEGDRRLAALRKLVEEIEALTALEEMSQRRELNLRFHLDLARICGNQVLERLYQMTLHQFPDWIIYEGMSRQEKKLPDRLARESGEHRELFEAVAAGQVERAAEIAQEHVLNLRDELVALLGVTPELLARKASEIGITV
jgi:DNA-binding GntR family transcriptional regulator